MNAILKAVSGMALLSMLCLSAGAGIIVYEGFDYPSGGTKPLTGLAGTTGGTGFSGPWTVTESTSGDRLDAGIDSHGLTYVKDGIALEVSGNSIYSQLGVPKYKCDELFRLIDTAALPPEIKDREGKLGRSETTLWFSFLVNLSDSPAHKEPPKEGEIIGWWAGIKMSTMEGWFGRNANSGFWSIEFPKKDSETAVTYGQTVFLVQKIEFTTAGAFTTLWVNPTPALNNMTSRPPEEPAILKFKADSFKFDKVFYSSSCDSNLDEIRIGTKYYDVAPGKKVEEAPATPATTTPETPAAPGASGK